MDAIFYPLRTGFQWKALDATWICTSSSAHRRFQEWRNPGVFEELWAQGLLDNDKRKGLNWTWQAMDAVMTKPPLGQEQNGPKPTDRAKRGV
jgi:transposase